MNKKQLYESIMQSISKEVKKALNENAPFRQGGRLYIMCDAKEQKIIQDLLDQAEAEIYDDQTIDEDCTRSIEIEEENITLAGTTGTLYGTADFCVRVDVCRNSDYEDHSWYECEISGVYLDDYDLTLTDDDGVEYDVKCSVKDMPRMRKDANIEDTDVRKQYIEQKKEAERRAQEIRWEENRKKKQAYEADVKANPEKYIKKAEELMDSAADNYLNWADAGEAEDIYNILGMKDEARRAHSTAVWGYHQEEAASGLL